ncbi:DUF4430 domain-containing protein [Paenibacillus pini]|uniref:Transcobalamin-like C-terminal domain-containing protein n=1 Tax=Paenibacillus pini JCM 16418 TaxID=1236976 RepID=W7YD44_9BACL|nr:DUF4430 domain-containing protein [Paenibacillus pini]GAF08830.1 hypothetical protein JCM16418_2937 [Paenibacillus pini JCM 16418]
MNKKRWLVAIMITAVLAIAFLWGGDYQKSPTQVADKNREAQSEGAEKSVSTEIAEATEEEVYQDKAKVNADSDTDTKVTDDTSVTDDASVIDESTAQTDSKETKVTPKAEQSVKTDNATGVTDKPILDKSTDTSKSTDSRKQVDADKKSPVLEKKPAEVTTKKPDKSTVSSNETPKADKPSTNTKPKKDKYLTDAVPSGKPKPIEWQDTTIKKDKELTVTLSVTAKTILDHMDTFNTDKLDVLPADGIIYKARKVTFYEGESVFDVLLREMKKKKIHMEFSMTPIYNSNYIEGINNIYEFDCGELSGWMYKVNGWFPNYGASRYVLKNGDIVDWVYTCDLGRDVGGDKAAMGGR